MSPAPLLPPAHEAPLPRSWEGASGTRHLLGVPYAALPGARPLELDLVLPRDESPCPVVVFIHGGGWRVGSRHAPGPMYAAYSPTPFERLAGAGVAVASVDYRLTAEATWPTQLHDVKAAVRYLRSRADEIGLDPERVGAWGESAGGHLALLLGMAGDPGLEGEVGISGPASDVRAVVAWYPPTDLSVVAGAPDDPETREALLLGAPPPLVPALAAEASPVTYASAETPPTLLLHGTGDVFIPVAQSETLHTILVGAGAPVTLHTYDGADHVWRGSPDVAEDALERTIAFLTRHL